MGHKLKVILTVILIASLGIFLSSGLQFYDAGDDLGSSSGQERQDTLTQADYTDGNGTNSFDIRILCFIFHSEDASSIPYSALSQ